MKPTQKPTQSTPRKTPVKSRSPVRSPKIAPIKSPQKPTQSTPRKTPVKSRSPVRSPKIAPIKSPQKPTQSTPRKASMKSQLNVTNEETCTLSPIETTSFIVGQGLGILNEYEDYPIENSKETANMPDPSFPEYGYNAAACVQPETTPGNSNFEISPPVDNLIGYYRGMTYEQQSQILTFLHMLTNTLQSYTNPMSTSGSSYTPATNLGTPGGPQWSQNAVPTVESPPVKELRKLPLINDDSNTYGDVVVNPSQLRSAEMRALTASTTKSGGIYLLNKVIEMVFNKEELRVSRGVKGLDQHKLEAIKEYMHCKCKKLNLDPVPPKIFNKTIQNKIGNIRHESKGRATLV